jgi:hypothetical protein
MAFKRDVARPSTQICNRWWGHQTILSLHGEAFLEPLAHFTSLTPRHETSRVSKDTHPVYSFSSRPRHRAYP